ncbi:hypothetical protein AcV7_004870 [Taiwanofungus camphoratus]|nr:hypothetical protein AcV7_004870 [Antrodia cinnamomea]
MASESLTDSAKLFSVEGLVAVVTGGATGIGLMIATALENSGAIVYIVSRRLQALEAAVSTSSRYGNMIALQGDVTDRESLLSVVETIKARHGYINLLVNNAGVLLNVQPKLPGPKETDIKTYQEILWNVDSVEDWAKTFNVNVTAVYYCTVAFMELLHAGNERSKPNGITSQVITISSLASFRKDSAIFNLPYSLSKVAVTHLGKMLSHYFKDWQIRSNVIAPGLFPSEMTDGMVAPSTFLQTIPLQRMGGIDDIGGLVLFLASKAGAYIDGAVHLLDGGRLLSLPSTM